MLLKWFADPSSPIRILHSAFTWANQMKAEAWRRFTKAQEDNGGKNISQNRDSGEAVHPSNLCFFLLIWAKQVGFLMHSSATKGATVPSKASGLGQASTLHQFKICTQQKLQHRNSSRHRPRTGHFLQPYYLSVLLIALHPKFLLDFFLPPSKNDATTQLQSILDIVSDSLQ